MDKVRCQSCGMPLQERFFGTNADGSRNDEFCTYCFQSGRFTEPDLTIPDMITISVHHMVTELHIPENTAKKLAEETIPHLKRWSRSVNE